MVCKHLSKLYDSLANLTWKMENEKMTKIANGMIAKDGEKMTMYGTCDCTGKVLNIFFLGRGKQNETKCNNVVCNGQG